MAGDFERIDTASVEGVAAELERLNTQLQTEVLDCQALINTLKNTWTGEASAATVAAFTAFANNYEEIDHKVIDSYVKFLRNSVAPGWEATETANTELGESFK